MPWVEKIRRADRDNNIDVYISDEHDDVLADGEFIAKDEPIVVCAVEGLRISVRRPNEAE